MDDNYFYTKFKKKSDPELLDILNTPDSYSEDAILAASHILKERGISLSQEQSQLHQEINDKRKKRLDQSKSQFSLLSRRLLALFLDLILLAILSALFGFTFIETSLVEDPWAIVVSWGLMLTYFTVFNSKVGGATIGKRVMGIKVKDYNNQPISLTKSLLRSGLLITPFFIIDYLPYLFHDPFGILSGIVVAFYFGIIYFLIVDKELRRTVHDLVTKTLVLEKEQDDYNFELQKNKVNIYYSIASVIVILFIVVNFSTQTNSEEYQEIISEQETLLEQNQGPLELLMSEVIKIEGVAEVKEINITEQGGIHTLEIIIKPNFFFIDDGTFDSIYQRLKELNMSGVTSVKITKYYGFDLTLASYHKTKSEIYQWHNE